MRAPFVLSTLLVASLATATGAHASPATHIVSTSVRDVGAMTELFTNTMRVRGEFTAHDRVTAYVARSIGAAYSPGTSWTDSSVLAVSYQGATYAYASFFVMKGDSFRSQVSMQDGGSQAVFVAHHGSWRTISVGVGWPPCSQKYLATLVPSPVAYAFWADACSPTR